MKKGVENQQETHLLNLQHFLFQFQFLILPLTVLLLLLLFFLLFIGLFLSFRARIVLFRLFFLFPCQLRLFRLRAIPLDLTEIDQSSAQNPPK